MVKDLRSQWIMNDRSGSWLKMKPDYEHGVEIDALIIGGQYGTGRNGVSQSFISRC
jgi:ATP-dependent DNA ligase